MFRFRRWARLAREEYALSPAIASGRLRGRPIGPRTLILSRTGTNRGLSAACPSVRTKASRRQRGSEARRTLLVRPPRSGRRGAGRRRTRPRSHGRVGVRPVRRPGGNPLPRGGPKPAGGDARPRGRWWWHVSRRRLPGRTAGSVLPDDPSTDLFEELSDACRGDLEIVEPGSRCRPPHSATPRHRKQVTTAITREHKSRALVVDPDRSVLLEVFCDRRGRVDEVSVVHVRQGDLTDHPVKSGQVRGDRCQIHQLIRRLMTLIRCESDGVLTRREPVCLQKRRHQNPES